MINLSGKVQKGKKRGKGLGFPTANITLNEEIEEGVYISQTVVDGKTYNSLTLIGAAETFGETEKKAESYILSFDQDIYGKEIKIRLIKKIRENMRFSSPDELVSQMQKDEEEARLYFNSSER